MASEEPFRVLFVCTGNICRSPMAQALLTSALRNRFGADADGVEVSSAGTYAVVGAPIESDALRFLDSTGTMPEMFAARQLVEQHVRSADLVLGAERAHRAAAVTLVPSASARTFTIREFVRLADAAEVDDPGAGVAETLRALVPAAARCRGLVRAADPADDDIADPYRRRYDAFETAGAQIARAITSVADRLAALRAGGTASVD